MSNGASSRDLRPTLAARGPRRGASTPDGVTPIAPAVANVAPIERMQDGLPGPLRNVPIQAMFAGGGLGAVALLTVGLALARGEEPILGLEDDTTALDGGAVDVAASPTDRQGASASAASASASAGPARLTSADLDAARLAGVDALRDLAQRYPEDPSVLHALGLGLRDRQDLLGAAKTVRHLLELAPERKTDRDVRQVLMDAANGPTDAAAEAFDLLKTKMDSAGPDILFEIATTASFGKAAHEHAVAALQDANVMRLATKALQIAEDLRRALPCARKTLIKRASADGDARSLPPLRAILPNPKGCGGAGLSRWFRGGSDCGIYACITPADRQSIGAAVEAIEARH